MYIVGSSATGDWATHDGELAYFDQVWRFIAPNAGITLWVADEAQHYTYNGSAWIVAGGLFANVKAFGAAGDGTTDDTLAVQNAVDAVHTAGGGEIYAPRGTYRLTAVIDIPENVIVRGAGQRVTHFDIDHDGVGFLAANTVSENYLYSSFRDFKITLPATSTGAGIRTVDNRITIYDLQCSGGSANSWMIDIDVSNECRLYNIKCGGDGVDACQGNGFIFRNTDVGNKPFGFGDAVVVGCNATLNADNLTGFKFEGTDQPAPAIAVNIICMGCYVSSRNSASGTNYPNNIAVHIYNASRITLLHFDIEQIATGVKHDSQQDGGAISDGCLFQKVIYLPGDAANVAYTRTGPTKNAEFIACDNFPGTDFLPGYADGDNIFAQGFWIGNPLADSYAFKLHDDGSGGLMLTNANGDDKLLLVIPSSSGGNPTLKNPNAGGTSRMFLEAGRNVQITPALQLVTNTSAPLSTDNGSLAVADGIGWDPDSTGTGGLFFRWGGNWIKLAP